MKKTVSLLFTIAEDLHADRILERLPRGHSIVRLNLDCPSGWKLAFLNGDVRLQYSDGTLGLEEIGSVFVRRIPNMDSFKRAVPESARPYAEYIAQQSFFLFSDCLAILDKETRFVNPLASGARMGKAVQARVAREVGLATPLTYMGSDPNTAREFCESIFVANGQPCVKPINNTKITINGKPYTQFTNKLSLDSLDHLESLSSCPTIFQQYVPKSYEVRATIIGDRIFAAKIESQQAGGDTATDWRRYNIPRTPHYPIDLPIDVSARLLALQKALALIYSAVDLVVTPEGEYVFLEANAYGQWLWIEDLTGLQISKAIAEYLAGPDLR